MPGTQEAIRGCPPQPGPSVRALARRAWAMYHDAPFATRLIQSCRPYICPFDVLLELVPEGAAVLEVGCGSGLFLGLLAQRARGHGFDTNPKAISAAVAMAWRLAEPDGGPCVTFEQCDARAGWPQGQFDVVALIDVIHHVEPDAQRAVLDQAFRSLRRGGRLIYKDLCIRPRWRAWANRLHDLVLARQWVHYLPISEVDSWASRKGLRLETAQTINRLWYGHELRVFEKPT